MSVATAALPETISYRDVAKWAGVHIRTVGVWVSRGLLPKPFRLGRRVYFDAVEVRARIDQLKREALANAS